MFVEELQHQIMVCTLAWCSLPSPPAHTLQVLGVDRAERMLSLARWSLSLTAPQLLDPGQVHNVELVHANILEGKGKLPQHTPPAERVLIQVQWGG
jgi:hypothetical protein